MKESNVLFENLIFMHWLQDAVFFFNNLLYNSEILHHLTSNIKAF